MIHHFIRVKPVVMTIIHIAKERKKRAVWVH